jgi:hypothetical protein
MLKKARFFTLASAHTSCINDRQDYTFRGCKLREKKT